MNIKKAVCTLRGHQWRNRTPYLTKGAPFCTCDRCHQIGWLV